MNHPTKPPHHPPPPHRRPPKPPKPNRTTLASCIVATIFLLFLVIIVFIIYFSLFKPKDPTISVTAIQLPSFTLSSNASAVSFTFSLYSAVKNTNRAVFSHFDNSLQLLYAGNQIGFMFIPAGKISAGNTEYIAATFSVQSFPISRAAPETAPEGNIPAMVGNIPVTDGIERVKPTMELEMKLEMVGRVRVLWVISHHVEIGCDCRISVAISDGSVLGFHC
ncbi:uncharacterized protein LOC110719291 [Chenopodium quinoa]|uniref:uncharacterized protein LOC110719291 n=1 Tax=Chenopodium quinoa TaxID=63459 RepID=UPI000B7817CE|nr:uncharacterized protein LOC110719291 [Chenopodium quinoa]